MSRPGRQSRVPLEERLRVVLGLLSGELSVSEAPRPHGVTNPTVANWRNRLEAGKAGLENTLPALSRRRPSGPHTLDHVPCRISARTEAGTVVEPHGFG